MTVWIIVMFISLMVMLLLGYPVAFTLGAVALVFGGIFLGFDFFNLLPLRIWGIMTNFTLIAVPLFIFMGVILDRSGLAEDLLETMGKLCGKLNGGLALSIVIVGAMLAATTGVVGATVVTMGIIALPTMLKHNYSTSFAAGTIAASGTLGQIIPPSLVLILLADVISSAYQQAQLNMGIFSPETVTISDLFAGALLPSLLLPIIYIFYIKSLKINSVTTPDKKDVSGSDANIIRSLVAPIFLIIIVLGSIIFGVATPSEAASLGAVGAIVLSLLKNKLKLSIIKIVSLETIKLTSMVFLILIGATFFSLVFRGLEGEELIHKLLSYGPENKYLSLIITLAIMFLLGFILDFIEIIFIVIPLFGPVLFTYGFDPVWVAILIAMVLQTSFLTPPFGFSLFYLRGVAPKEISTQDIYKGVIPFIIIQIIAIVIVFLIPEIATMLPRII